MSLVAVLAVGNDARGDDALGPMLLARLENLALPAVRLVLDFQFQVEHALDLDGAERVLFLDAHCNQTAPVVLAPVLPAPCLGGASHALTPGQVLGVRERIGRPVPEAWVLSLAGADFSLGAGLSGCGWRSLEAGWDCLQALLEHPTSQAWRARAQGLQELAGMTPTLLE